METPIGVGRSIVEDERIGSWAVRSLPGIEVIGALLDVSRALAEQRSRGKRGTWEIERR